MFGEYLRIYVKQLEIPNYLEGQLRLSVVIKTANRYGNASGRHTKSSITGLGKNTIMITVVCEA